jgi:predicted ArsR family transcriptional regulator
MSSDSGDRVLYSLKSRGPLGTYDLARALGITEVGTRQHLARLHDDGLVTYQDQSGEVGRPKRIWRLTAKGHARFPDTHGDLTVSLIEGIRSVFGTGGWIVSFRRDRRRSWQAIARHWSRLPI